DPERPGVRGLQSPQAFQGRVGRLIELAALFSCFRAGTDSAPGGCQMGGVRAVGHEMGADAVLAKQWQESPMRGVNRSVVARKRVSPAPPGLAGTGGIRPVREVLIEDNALCRQPVKRGRIDPLVAVAAEIVGAQTTYSDNNRSHSFDYIA